MLVVKTTAQAIMGAQPSTPAWCRCACMTSQATKSQTQLDNQLISQKALLFYVKNISFKISIPK